MRRRRSPWRQSVRDEHAGPRGGTWSVRGLWLAFLLIAEACAATSATVPPDSSSGDPPAATGSPADPTAVPTTTLMPLPGEPSIPGAEYVEMPVSLELKVDCGYCETSFRLSDRPHFRLYADGLALFRTSADDWAPYRFAKLDDDDFEALLVHALDEGGLRGAEPRYPGDADDIGGFRLALHAQWVDMDADVDVQISPLVGSGDLDIFGDPIEDLPRRERLLAFTDLLMDFDRWLADRGEASEPFIGEAYSAAILDRFEGGGDRPWPWSDLAVAAFARDAFGARVARITPGQAAEAGVGLGGGSLGSVSVEAGWAANILVLPVLPGEDRPGAFGLRPDTVAVTVEGDLRVRSLPEVSDSSAKLTPLLATDDRLYVIDGPTAGSGYEWYEVYAPRTGLSGWVAAGAKTGEDWIRPVPLPCSLGAESDWLMHLACFKDVEFAGNRFLGPSTEELRCPDVLEWWFEPFWLNGQLACSYEFRPEEAETGSHDLISAGVLHASLENVPMELLAAHPAGLLVEVRGGLDHPDARTCTTTGDNAPAPALAILFCRATFVITELRPAE